MERKKRNLVVSMLSFFVVYLFVVALIMRQWHSPEPWSRIDGYVIALMAFSLAMATMQTITSLRISDSAEITNEFFGLTFDRAMSGWVSAIGGLDLLAFADYAHWRLVPTLVNRALQMAGVALYALAFAWMWRVDVYMIANFERATQTIGCW